MTPGNGQIQAFAAVFQPALLSGEALWLSQRQIAELFGVKTAIVADLIRHLYKTAVLDKETTVRKQRVAQSEGKRQVIRELNCYNRTVALAVGWRVNSRQGEQFRRWANETLEAQCRHGYTLDQQRLEQDSQNLQELAGMVGQLCQLAEQPKLTTGGELEELLTAFPNGWQRLAMFAECQLNNGAIPLRNKTMLAARPLEYFEVLQAIDRLRAMLFASDEAGEFGVEKDGRLESLLESVTARGSYSSIEEQAALLLWLVLHRRPFVDGNLQLGAFLFVWFLQRNALLCRDDGSLRLRDNALVSMVLLAARAPDQDRDLLISLLASLINREN